MLLLFFQYTYVFIVFICVGFLFAENLLQLRFKNVFHYFGFGIIFSSTIVRVWCLFTNTSSAILQVVMLGLAVSSLVINRQFFTKHFWHSTKLGFSTHVVIIGVYVLFFSSQQSISYDEGLYHASFIAWLNKYGIVKGLANTHGRMGFDSSWHMLVSAFNLKWLFDRPFNQLNGLFLLNTLLYFNVEKKLRMPASSFIDIVCLLFLCPLLLVYHLIDPSADYVVILWLTILAYEVYHFDSSIEDRHSISVLILISVCFLITVKLSVMPSVLLILPVLKYLNFTKRSLVLITSSTFIIAVWIVNNYWLSGYLIYPFVDIRALSPIWKVPSYIAHFDVLAIKYTPVCRWANISLDQVASISWWGIFKTWYSASRFLEKLLFVLSVFAILSAVIINLRTNRFRMTVLFWCLIGFAIVVYNVPDFRFYCVYSFCAMGSILSLVKVVRIIKYLNLTLIVLSLGITSILYLHLKPKVNNPVYNWHEGLAFDICTPERYPLAAGDTLKMGKDTIYVFDQSAANFAWDVVPCIYYPVEKKLTLISYKISSGLYVKRNKSVTGDRTLYSATEGNIYKWQKRPSYRNP